MPKLIIQHQGQEWFVELKEGSNTMGRASTCTIPVRDVNMSREHIEVQLTGDVATLFDKGSMNGTLLNGAKILERKLVPGDKIQIGASTIYFQEKNAGEPELPKTAAPKGGSDEATKPGRTEVMPGKPSQQKKSEVRRPASHFVKDFAIWGKAGGLSAGAVGAIVSLVLVVGIAVVALKMFGGGGGQQLDADNLLGLHGQFDAAVDGKPPGWLVKQGLKSTMAVESAVGRNGSSALAVSKSGDPGDFVFECQSADEYALVESRRVNVSAWAKVDGFSGHVALKIGWTTTVRGPVVHEEISAPIAKPGDWVKLEKEFLAPPGAGGFVVSLCAIGRSGRVLFDDARVALNSGPEAARESTMGPFGVTVGPTGALAIQLQGKCVLSNVQLALASDKEGVSTQAVVTKLETKRTDTTIQISGKLVSPIDLRDVDFEQHVALRDDNLFIAYTVPTDQIKQVETLNVLATLPRAERISGVPNAGDPGTMLVVARSEGVDVGIDYVDPTRVSLLRERGGQKLTQIFAIDRSEAKTTVVIKLRAGAASLGAGDDPIAAAQKERERGGYAGALSLLKQYIGRVREPDKRKKMADEIRKLEDEERTDWMDVQAAGFRAQISRRAEQIEMAMSRVSGYQRKWSGDPYLGKVQPVREELERLSTEAAGERDAERAKRLLERAKAYAQSGRRTLAAEVCEMLLVGYGQTPAAKEAQEILKSLQGQ